MDVVILVFLFLLFFTFIPAIFSAVELSQTLDFNHQISTTTKLSVPHQVISPISYLEVLFSLSPFPYLLE